MPNGQLPVLEVDGKKLSQSEAIYRYLGREYNLYGKNNWEASIIDSIMGQYKDFFDEVKDFILTAAGYAEKGDLNMLRDDLFVPNILRDDLFVPASKKFFPILQKYIKDTGNGYLTENGPTWIDFFFAEEFDGLNHLSPGFYDTYPEFKQLNAKIHGLPQLQAYLKSRPQSAL
uniref:Glutathione S-transferase n=1 Tax=Panagrolaimus sp. PS1159 TaxID=55785 RepID=A0AC35FA44_9BILA